MMRRLVKHKYLSVSLLILLAFQAFGDVLEEGYFPQSNGPRIGPLSSEFVVGSILDGQKAIAAVDRKVDRLEAKVDQGFKDIRSEMRAQGDDTPSKMRAQGDDTPSKMRAQGDDTPSKMHAGFASMDERFASMDERFAKIDERFAKINGTLAMILEFMNQSIVQHERVEEFKSNTSVRLDGLESHWTMNLGGRVAGNPAIYLCVATLVSAVKAGVAYPESIIPEGLFVLGAVSTQELGWLIFSPSIPQVLEPAARGLMWGASMGISYSLREHKSILSPLLTAARLTGGAAVLAVIAAIYSKE
jgi:hypothetical protein